MINSNQAKHSKGNIMNNTNFGIVKTFNENDFINEFKAYDRMGNFSYEGLRVMFDALNELAQDCEMNIEMDVIALCCEYNEDSITDIINNYGIDVTDLASDDLVAEFVEEYLQNNTSICGKYEDEYGVTYFIYQSF